MKRKLRQRYEKTLDELTLMSNKFAMEVFKHKECAEHLLRTLLKDEIIRLRRVEVEKTLTNMWGKGVRLDVMGVGTTGDVYEAEIQNNLSEASVNRASYNGALMAMHTIKKGIKFKKKKRYRRFHVVFITDGDAGADIHYFNTQIQDDSPIGKIMHDFHTANVDDMQDEVLKKYVGYYKRTPEGRKHMCKIMDKIHRDGERAGFRKGEKRKSKMIAISLYESGMPIQEIMKHTRESEQQIRKWVMHA